MEKDIMQKHTMKKTASLYQLWSMAIGLMALCFTTACDPLEDRYELSNTFNPDNVTLVAEQTAGGNGNGITLKMTTPGVYGYWDYKLGKKYTDRVDFNFPYTGKVTFTYHITSFYIEGALKDVNKSEITKDIEVEISELDQPIDKPYYALVGQELQSKTWVFNREREDKLWWFMSPGNSAADYLTCWWNAGGDGLGPDDEDGKMVFDLQGGANYTYYPSADAEPVKGGSFSFNADFTKLQINGEKKILGNTADRGNPDGEYIICSLTDDELILYVPNNQGGTGWTWIFKPQQ